MAGSRDTNDSYSGHIHTPITTRLHSLTDDAPTLPLRSLPDGGSTCHVINLLRTLVSIYDEQLSSGGDSEEASTPWPEEMQRCA